VIERKTAVLFAAATRLGALLAGAEAATCDTLHEYGLNLGYAFQIADDVLDYSADEAALGKHLGDDLAEGKATLPLIHAIANADAGTRDVLRQAIADGDAGAMPDVLAAIARSRSLEYSLARARDYADAAEAALDGLPANAYVGALRGLARYAISRDRRSVRPGSRASSAPRARRTAGCRRNPADCRHREARNSGPFR
jgi:octaprenyl-diphosphate synthase